MGIGSFAFNNAEATQDGLGHSSCTSFGQNQIGRDVWFRWRCLASAQYTVDTCTGTNFDTKLAVYNNVACPPVTPIMCNDDSCGVQSRITFSATQNQMYLVRVGSFPGGAGGPGTLRIQFAGGQATCNFPAANCQAKDNSNAFESTASFISDDFTPQANGTISGICFNGTYFDGLTNCQGRFPDDIIVEYFLDFGGEPDFAPFAQFRRSDYTIVGPVSTGGFINGSFNEYAYKITHPGVQVFGNSCYWVRITNELPPPPNGNCAWYWEMGVPGNTIAFQGETRVSTDMNFCLSLAIDPSTECSTPDRPANDNCASAVPLSCSNTIDADSLFATTATNDPEFTCRIGGAGQGVGTMWYRFNATQTSARVSLCASSPKDTMLAVYSGSCGNFTLRGCNDDFCGQRSQVCVTGLTVGQTYFVQVASFNEDGLGPFSISLACPCPPAPANDACAAATTVATASFMAANTLNANPDPVIPQCGFSLVSGPGVWYSVVGNGRRLTADLCGQGTNYDTKLSIFCGPCSQLVCIGENDDSCGILSRIQWCSQAGRPYFIYVHGFSGSVGNFELRLSTEAAACSPFQNCDTCELTCPVGGVPESEACGQSTNGGCNGFPVEVEPVLCGEKICGTIFASGSIRDTDWYEFSINTPSTVTWSVQSETPVDALLLDALCPPTVIFSGTTARCGTALASGVLQPGTYRAFVGAVGDGYPCGASSQYIAQLTCAAVGPCCVGADCTRMTEAQCTTAMGVYGGDGNICPFDYSVTTCSNAFEDVSASGNPIILTGDEGASIPIGFTFKFYGVNYANIGVSANGYLSFDTSLGEQVNAPIPGIAVPNAIIAPFWDDLAPESGGSIHFTTLGASPNRRLLVQWKNIPQFLDNDSNTFQAVLFETSNCIEFRYGAFTPQATAGDYTIGVENQAGTDGTSINPSSIIPNSCRRLCPILDAGGCTVIQQCPGDANGDDIVNFQDVVSVLANWGGMGPLGDADSNGTVDFPDIISVLANWNQSCGAARCPGDANVDGIVSFPDITSVLANWSTSGPLGDANGDGNVNFPDVIQVLAFWNQPCP